MIDLKHNFLLLHEEKKALRLYLILFYTVLVLYDLFYYYIYPIFAPHAKFGLVSALGFWLHLIMGGLLPVLYYLNKIDRLYIVKYIYVLTYFVLSTIDDVLTYLGRTTEIFQSGNAAEITLLLFSPIFINKRFFLAVSTCITIKYTLIGLLLGNGIVLSPIILIGIFAIIAYILLTRFYSYIEALTETHEKLRDKEKLAFVGQMATTIEHEIRNPLASLKGFTQLQREKHKEDEQHFLIMEQEIDRIDSILNDLLVIGKPRQLNVKQTNLIDLINYVISITNQSERGKQSVIDLTMDQSFPIIECDPKQMKQVILNLIKNELESMANGGRLTIIGGRITNDKVSIRISDEGCGISEAAKKKLFEPFFTTKDYGTGLGLMVSRKIIEDHQGMICISSTEGKGTIVE